MLENTLPSLLLSQKFCVYVWRHSGTWLYYFSVVDNQPGGNHHLVWILIALQIALRDISGIFLVIVLRDICVWQEEHISRYPFLKLLSPRKPENRGYKSKGKAEYKWCWRRSQNNWSLCRLTTTLSWRGGEAWGEGGIFRLCVLRGRGNPLARFAEGTRDIQATPLPFQPHTLSPS